MKKNGVALDAEKIIPGGCIRIGTHPRTTHGRTETDMKLIAGRIHRTLESRKDDSAHIQPH